MYFNQTDIVHLRTRLILSAIIAAKLLTTPACWAENTSHPININLSHNYNEIIKIDLPTIIIKSIGQTISFEYISVNQGRCKTNAKRKNSLPTKLNANQSIEIRLMLGCKVKEILIGYETKTDSGVTKKEWIFIVDDTSNMIETN
jgi:hypothetical protein